jgi:hypothetical protein
VTSEILKTQNNFNAKNFTYAFAISIVSAVKLVRSELNEYLKFRTSE